MKSEVLRWSCLKPEQTLAILATPTFTEIRKTFLIFAATEKLYNSGWVNIAATEILNQNFGASRGKTTITLFQIIVGLKNIATLFVSKLSSSKIYLVGSNLIL